MPRKTHGVITRYRWSRSHRVEGAKTLPKHYWEVACQRHGKEIGGLTLRVLKVSPPKSRRHRGCPACRRLAPTLA